LNILYLYSIGGRHRNDRWYTMYIWQLKTNYTH